MMHCKLVDSINALALALYCCFQLLLILCASINGDANSTASCSSSNFMECADLGNISYPFWGSASCAASPSYVLSNCTSSSASAEAYWESFSTAANGVVGPPAVTAVEVLSDEQYSQAVIQISWNESLIDLGYCAPLFSSKNLSLYNIPSSINLTRFSDSSALEFSPNSTYLLFNCTQYNASNVDAELGSQNFQEESASGCMGYKGLCPSRAKTPCIQWSVSSLKELPLQHVLESFACSHFIFGVASLNEFGINEWSTGSIELIWTDVQCKKCQNANGACFFDEIIHAKFNRCMCSNNIALDLTTQAYCDNSNYVGCHGGPLKCNTGAKVGVAVAVVAALGILIAAHKFKEYNLSTVLGLITESIRNGFVSFTKVTIPIAINVLKTALRKLQSVSYGHDKSLDSIDFDGLTERPKEYSYSTIASATKSFSSLVGEGGFGSVYKGEASSRGGSEVVQIAVKVLEVKSKHSKKQFLNEVVTIGRIHHVNVVRLLGFCMQEDHEMLVYEYVVNGSLDRWLFAGLEKAEDQVLNWGQRYAIALGVARGLSYLHEECRHRTVHCDIKPQNILLDENMQPKIADFGMAKLMGREESKVVTLAKGTPGYMAPEFWMGGESQLSTKFDVYSYGMVMLELISGRRNFRQATALSEGASFPATAFKAAMEGDLESLLDSRLSRKRSTMTTEGVDEAVETKQDMAQSQQLKTAVFIALWCIQDHPEGRPSMSEVVKYLEGGAAVSERPPQPNISTFSAPSAISTVHESPNSSCNDHNDSISAIIEGR